ncbi:unnamed protein product [Symbiodinium sp. CCMP2456]|nr:unnamed protein product [Symbiodinium sp. CCMP2456]
MAQFGKVKIALQEAHDNEKQKGHQQFSYKEVLKQTGEKLRKCRIDCEESKKFEQSQHDGQLTHRLCVTWRVGTESFRQHGDARSNKKDAERSAWEMLYRQVARAVEEAEQHQVPVVVELNRVLPSARFGAAHVWSMQRFMQCTDIFSSCASGAGDAQSNEDIVATGNTQSSGSGEETPRSATGSAATSGSLLAELLAASKSVEDKEPQGGAMVSSGGTFVKYTPEDESIYDWKPRA